MDVIWNKSRMQDLLRNFFTLMKVRVGFFDLDSKEIIAFPAPRTDYCNLIRSTSAGDEACQRCDRAAFGKALKYHGPYIYQCHAGLTEVITPIITSEEERIGYLMIGQVRPPGTQDERQWKEIRLKAGHLCPHPRTPTEGSPLDSLRAAYFKLNVIGMDEIRACANILQALASYVWLDNYIRIQQEPLSSRVKTYITDRLDSQLSLSGIARQFGCGKTTLCKVIKRDCDMTVNELIRTSRIERARQLLQSGKQSVAEIAEQVGIMDYNYFTKVFKKEFGVPPSVFRRLCEGGYLYNAQKS